AYNTKNSFLFTHGILEGGIFGPNGPIVSFRDLVGAAGPTPRASRGLRAPAPRGPGLVGATRPHTPGFTFGRPKVNRKTAKSKVLDSFVQSVCINGETSLPLNEVFVI